MATHQRLGVPAARRGGGARLPETRGRAPLPRCAARLDALRGHGTCVSRRSAHRSSIAASTRGAVAPALRPARAGPSRAPGWSAGSVRRATLRLCCSSRLPATARPHCSRNGPRGTGAGSHGSTSARATMIPSGCSLRSRGRRTTPSLPRCLWWTTRTSSERPRRSTPWTTWRARCRPVRSLRWRPGAQPGLPVGSLRAPPEGLRAAHQRHGDDSLRGECAAHRGWGTPRERWT